jgi:hypothetical protein
MLDGNGFGIHPAIAMFTRTESLLEPGRYTPPARGAAPRRRATRGPVKAQLVKLIAVAGVSLSALASTWTSASRS